jgi:mannose-6-phosphate isomerase-like protein (cupin superfamily)
MTTEASHTATSPVIDPTTTYLHFGEGPEVRREPVTPDFWSAIGARDDLDRGRLLTSFPQDSDWTVWERHPAGDELVYLVDGTATVHLDDGGRTSAHRLCARQAVLVPAGVWHTVDVHEPGHVLVLTWGEGTEHRPR